MKPKSIIFLVVLLVLCAGYFVIRGIGWSADGNGNTEKPRDKEVFAATPRGARRLTIAGADGGRVVLEKKDGSWWITEPVARRAVRYSVTDVIKAIGSLKYERVYEDGHADAPGPELTGLDNPRWTVTLVDEKDDTYALAIGRPVSKVGAEGDRTYVRPAGSRSVFVVAVDFASKLDKSPDEWSSRDLLDVNTGDVVAVKVTGGEGFELARSGDRAWRIVSPVSARADRDKVRNFLQKAIGLQVSRFIDAPGDLSRYALDSPALTVELSVKAPRDMTPPVATAPATARADQPRKITLIFGGRTMDKVYAKLDSAPTVFQLDGSVLDDLQPTLGELRDKHVLDIAAPQVTKIQLDLPAGKAELVRSEGKWLMSQPLVGKANNRSVADLLDRLAALKATKFRDDELAGGVYRLDSPRGKITLHLAGEDRTVALAIGADSVSGETTGVRLVGGKAVAIIGSGDAGKLLADPATYWNAVILEFPRRARIIGLTLKRPDGSFTLVRRDGDGIGVPGPDGPAWKMTAPLEAPAEVEAVNKVLDALESLTADRIVAFGMKLPVRYADARKAITATVTTELPAPRPAIQPEPATLPAATQATQPATAPKPIRKTYTVVVVKIGAHSYVWRPGQPIIAVGELSASFYNTFAAEMRSRRVLRIEPRDVEKIRIVAGADALDMVRRKEDQWEHVPYKDVKIDAAKVAAFLRDARAVRAERFVTHDARPADVKKYALDKPWLVLELTTKEGGVTRLRVSHEPSKEPHHRYAEISGVQGVFLLPAKMVEKLAKSPADFRTK